MSDIDTIFGICQRCGSDGRSQSDDLTGADAPASETTGNGVELEKFRGQYLCPVCINEIKNEGQSLRSATKHAAEERFRAQAGFVQTIEGE